MSAPLRAYHGDPAIKAKYLTRVAKHRAADELIKGTGWTNGKGCAIGCTLESYEHARYPIELGIPKILAQLEDCIFEGLPIRRSQKWPEQFLDAITPGADLSRVGWQFLHWLLTSSGIVAFDHPLVKDAVAQCAAALRGPMEGRPINKTKAAQAAQAAWAAVSSALASALAAELASEASEALAASALASASASASELAAELASELAAQASASALASASASASAYIKMADLLLLLLRAAK